MSIRTYYDPLHHGISLNSNIPEESMVMALIDAEPFQRLRRIRQLGPAFLTFHGAESSRFTHSLGVFHIARKAFQKLILIDKSLSKSKGLLYGAALLHDLGHGPLSHTGEEIFGLKHEYWSAKLIREHPSIKGPLDAFQKDMSEKVAKLVEGNSQSSNNIIKSLISSQLDCDRLDYLARDSYSTGTQYGHLDLERILSALIITPDGGLAIHPKGLMAVEHYLVVRNLMYRSVYNHRLNEVCTWLLEQLIRTARKTGPKLVWADETMSKWLWEPSEIDLNTFLGQDDLRMGYHLLRWKEEGTKTISELCERLINRNLLKALTVGNLENELQLESLVIARNLSEKSGFDPDFCCGLRHQSLHGYHPYRGGLRLWDGIDLKAIENVSPIVASLTSPADLAWLIHPREIHNDLKKELYILKNKAG